MGGVDFTGIYMHWAFKPQKVGNCRPDIIKRWHHVQIQLN